MKHFKLKNLAYLSLGLVAGWLYAASVYADDGEVRYVHCDQGKSLQQQLNRARPGQKIVVIGVCQESVTIWKDFTYLVGTEGAGIDGSLSSSEAVVLIDGARRVRVENLFIENGSDQGVLATHGAQGLLNNLIVRNNATVGVSIDRSHFDITNLQTTNNGSSGMDIFTGSTIVARGKIVSSDNSGDGIAVNGKSFFELRGAQVTASNNGGSGISAINDSRIQIFSFPEAQGSSITADANGFAGIGLLGAELGVVGSQFFGSGANVITATNNIIGFFMPAGAILSPHATAKFVAQFNGVGMVMEDGASALIVGGLDVSQNGVGISAKGAGTVNIVSVPPNPSSATMNQLDVELAFGTRATFAGTTVDSISCDDTVLIQGTVSCPEPTEE